jgi:hypothetical protein
MKLNILLLCNKPKDGSDANTIIDHLDALEHYSTGNFFVYSNLGDLSTYLKLDYFDVIIIHYSLSLIYDQYISHHSKQLIQQFQGLKVVFIQDEYRQINKMVSQLKLLDVDVIFTCFPETEMDKIYDKRSLPHVSLYNNLTGYVPQRLLDKTIPPPLLKHRPLHVGYRSRKLPFWYGVLAYEKWDIVIQWMRHVKRHDIKVDLSYHESDRIYGDKWLDFVQSCKAMLGVESGASVMDFTGELEKKIDFHQLTHPNDDFFKVQNLYLQQHEGLYKLNQISPRCFEAVALKTVLVLYEGEYSGILIPNKHYIMLKKDFTNIDEVIEKLLDDELLQNMADLAYQEIALNPEYSYKQFGSKIDQIIKNEFKLRGKKKVKDTYFNVAFKKAINKTSIKTKALQLLKFFYAKLPASVRLKIRVFRNPKMLLCYICTKFYRAALHFFPEGSQRGIYFARMMQYPKHLYKRFFNVEIQQASTDKMSDENIL